MPHVPAKDPSALAAEAAAAATAGALAKVKAAEAEKQAADTEAVPAPAPGLEAAPSPTAESARFFVRRTGALGEHHLKDHFQQYGDVVEVQLVRDKKTQRPRGMAFVSLVPRKPEEGPAPSLDEMIDNISGAESHNIKGTEVEVQEALPKPAEEKEEDKEENGKQVAAAPALEEPQETIDPQAQAQAQAQWQMHYLAMAINASVPDLSSAPPAPGGGGRQAQGGEPSKGSSKGKGGRRKGPY